MGDPRVPATVRDELPGWAAARRYGVPSSMVVAATERRVAGDWRGACAAARMDIALDLDRTERFYGRDVAGAVRDDLAHLAPDLVRWHLPRHSRDGRGLLEPGLVVPLAVYRAGTSTLALRVRTPAHLEVSQRLLLELTPVTHDHRLETRLYERWDTARFRWDVRASPGLRRFLGGGERTPFFRRDGARLQSDELPAGPIRSDPVAFTEWVMLAQDRGAGLDPWRAAGFDADLTPPKGTHLESWSRVDRLRSTTVVTLMTSLRAELVRRGEPYRAVLLPRHWHALALEVAVGSGPVVARVVDIAPHSLPVVPVGWWRRAPDLELLRHGRLTHGQLHPMVRAALFPDEPRTPLTGYQPLPGSDPTGAVPVRCSRVWHEVTWQPAGIRSRFHTDDEIRREDTFAALGGPVSGCAAAIRAWTGRGGRLPSALRLVRTQLNAAVAHCDIDEVERLLAAGVDPIGVRDRAGRTLLHRVGRLGRADLVPRLVAAGLDVDGRDPAGSTALLTALFDGAPEPVVHALLDAGADAGAVNAAKCGALHLIRSRDAARIVPRLVAAGLDIEARDDRARTPLQSVLAIAAPPPAIRALLVAGADPTVATDPGETLTGEELVSKLSNWGYGDE
jgi:hypothetical protein